MLSQPDSLVKDVSDTEPFGKSLRVYRVPANMMDEMYEEGKIPVKVGMQLYPNQPLVLKANGASSLAVVTKNGRSIRPVTRGPSFVGISGRNKEQSLLMELLNDPEIRCIVVTGRAGTGKTTVISSYALSRTALHDGGDTQQFDKLILSKPLEIVTNSRYWGTVPGDEDDKMAPFLKSFEMCFKAIAGDNGTSYIDAHIENRSIEFIPLELMRGASLRNCICWYDEAQNLDAHECETLGSRLDDTGGSKLILSGDLGQRDRNISHDKTGLIKLVTSRQFLESRYTAHVDLIKNERGEISNMFYEVFND